MLEHPQFRVHHALDADRVHLLGPCHRDASRHGVWISSLVIFESEVIHVFIFVRAHDVTVHLVLVVDEEDASEDEVADHLGQFCERVDGESVLIDVAVDGKTVSHTLHSVRIVVCLSAACHVLRFPCPCL